jgi:hypothetical protein
MIEDYKNYPLSEAETRLRSTEQANRDKRNSRSMAFLVGTVLGGAALALVIYTSFPSSTSVVQSSQYRNVSSFLAGMFGFTAIEAFRRSFK